MASTGGVKMNWPLIAIAFAVIGVPLGVAMIQDLGTERDEEELLARISQLDEIQAVDPAESREPAEEIAGRWREPGMDQAFFDQVFLGGPEDKQPALRGPLAGIRLGDLLVDAQAASPALASWLAGEPPPGLARARIEVVDHAGSAAGIDEIAISFPDDGTAARIFSSRWGEPLVMVGDDGRTREVWFDPAGRLRFALEQGGGDARATFHSFIPARAYLEGSGRFAFEDFPILGATPELLAKKYGRLFTLEAGGTSGRLDCPGTEVSQYGALCLISFAGGKAVKLSVILEHALDADGGPALFAGIRSGLGPVRRQSSDEAVNHWSFQNGVTVTQQVGEHGLTVERVAR